MTGFIAYLPFGSCLISFVFAAAILRRYLAKGGAHLLLWAVGMVFFSIGSFAEAYYVTAGWQPLMFRLWYLFGAVLVAAWLGQGTVYLLARRRWANVSTALLLAASVFATYRVFGTELDPSRMVASLQAGAELSGQAIIDSSVRALTPIFNIYGTVMLVGGAAWSAWIFWRKRIMPHRVIGNVLIAAGAILPALGGTMSRFGIPGTLYITEFLGAILLFIGFLRAITPMTTKDGPASRG